MIKFTIPGDPMGKGRPRVAKYGTYTPKKTVEYENLVKEFYWIEGNQKLEGYIKCTIHAYYYIPQSTSKKKREQMIKGEIRPTKKPDLDNVAKIICDSLNKLAYNDDSQIIDLTVTKQYGEIPRVEVILQEIN